MATTVAKPDLAATMQRIGAAARAAAQALSTAPSASKDRALRSAAVAVRQARERLLQANALDIASAKQANATNAFIDRVMLNADRIEGIAKGLEDIAAQPDPVGHVQEEWTRPNGLKIARVAVPFGVVGIIYEARPNVTADAGGLCLKSGNAAVLRGGSESFESSRVLVDCLHEGLRAANLPDACVQLVPTRDRDAVGHMLTMNEFIDVIVPRGGKPLIERVMKEARIPVISHLEGLCHTYVHRAADVEMARRVVVNAKMRRTGICGATETLLVDRAAAVTHLPPILHDLFKAGCEVRGTEEVQRMDPRVMPATEVDWRTEYLDALLSVKLVDGLDEAVGHINHYGSHHTDAIITADAAAAEKFLETVDSAIVLHNASTQFADGGEFGFGAEIGISTGRLPPRGPVGAAQLTTYKYVIRGAGQTRP
ncbi:MAG TPA: glutamate-5-semialdehyde dehydrogenase [Alphaproteobacteria bacterium]|nr:glutamate-5-semialdehyde dehydrogenase [Alphaproteobacteria bacterium]